MTFAEKLKSMRKQSGMSQEKLAEKNRSFKTGYNQVGK